MSNNTNTWLVPYDHSDCAMEAALLAAGDLQTREGTLVLFNAFLPPMVPGTMEWTDGLVSQDALMHALETDTAEGLERAAEQLRADFPKLAVETLVAVGDPADLIIAEADDRGVGRIVMGTHGRSGISHFFMGSVAERVVRRAKVPVLVVKSKERPS